MEYVLDGKSQLDQAHYEVEVYENRINMLVSVHKEKGRIINWQKIANTPQPLKPSQSNKFETETIAKSINFKPNIIHRIFGLEDKTRVKLAQSILEAKEKDNIANKKLEKEWIEATVEWTSDTEFAQKIVNKES